jgi:hypothetical protein
MMLETLHHCKVAIAGGLAQGHLHDSRISVALEYGSDKRD